MKHPGGQTDSRRTSHKAAEQKRRDSLKYSFDELRGYLPAIMVDDEAPGGSILGPDGLPEDEGPEDFSVAEIADAEQARIANKGISKVSLLRHSNEYLLRIRARMDRRDHALKEAREEVLRLRGLLAEQGVAVEETEVLRSIQRAAGGRTAPSADSLEQYVRALSAAGDKLSSAAAEAARKAAESGASRRKENSTASASAASTEQVALANQMDESWNG